MSLEYPTKRISQRRPVPFGLVGAGVNMQILRTQERLDIFQLVPGRGAGRPDRYAATSLIHEGKLAGPNLAAQRPLVDHAVVPGTHKHEVGQAGRPPIGPGVNMMGMQMLLSPTAGHAAATVTRPQRATDRRWDRPSPTTHVK